MPTKRALIIGINKYPHMSEKYQLTGCVNDAKLISSILINNKYNFDPENITALYDEAATRDAVLAEMDRIAYEIGQDDILVFHYSGHGSLAKIKTEHTDEGSGSNNCILLSDDSKTGPDGKKIYRDIRDEKFRHWLQKLATKTRYTTLIFDCCHSGTMTRSSPGSTRVRSVPAEVRLEAETDVRFVPESGDRTTPGEQSGSADERPGAGGWLTLSDNYVVISGCRDKQKSKEKTFIRDGEKLRHGALTFNLSHPLRHAKPGTTYRDVFETVVAGVVSDVTNQNPQIEGAIDRELFGVKEIEPLRYIPIRKVSGDTLTLDGGAAHGLRRDSKWAIYPPGTKQADPNEKIGTLKINKVGALASKGILTDASGTVVTGARCVEIESGNATDPLLIDLGELSPRARTSIESAIRRSPLLAVADEVDASDISAHIIDSADALPDAVTAAQKASVAGPTWAFFEDEGNLCMPLHPVNERGVAHVLVNNLEKIARYRNIMRLDNPDPRIKVKFNLYKKTANGELELANGGNTEFGENDQIVFEITNHEPERTVFFSIIWISATREIMHFYPYQKACEELAPGKTVRYPPGDGNPITAELGEDYVSDVGPETCKAIFSTRETDYRWLNQEGTRTGDDENAGIPAADAALNGAAPGASGDENNDSRPTPQPDDWDAIGRTFILTRSSS